MNVLSQFSNYFQFVHCFFCPVRLALDLLFGKDLAVAPRHRVVARWEVQLVAARCSPPFAFTLLEIAESVGHLERAKCDSSEPTERAAKTALSWRK